MILPSGDSGAGESTMQPVGKIICRITGISRIDIVKMVERF